MKKKLSFLLFPISLLIHAQETEKITRGVCTNCGINIGQSMNNAGSSYYQSNIVTPVFFQGNIKQSDLKPVTNSGDAMFTINIPGRYYVASDLKFESAVNGTIGIKISTSNVILDLNSKMLTDANSATVSPGTSSFILIQIEPGVSNITITNGKLIFNGATTNALDTAIFLNKNASQTADNIELSNLIISKFNNGGIREEGSSTLISNTLTISNIYIRESNGDAATQASAISLFYRQNITIQNSTFNNNNSEVFAMPLLFLNCSNIKISNCDTSYNRAPLIYGSVFNNCQDIELSYCNSSTNTSTNGFNYSYAVNNCSNVIINSCISKNIFSNAESIGFFLANSTGVTLNSCRAFGLNSYLDSYGFYNYTNTGSKFYNCEATNIKGQHPLGFNSLSSNNCLFYECLSLNNSSTNSSVFGFSTAEGGSNNTYDKCIALSNISTANSASGIGFYFSNESNSTIKNCEASNNGDSQANGNGYGVIFEGGAYSCTNCIVINNKLFNNFGGLSQYGFVDRNSSSYSTVLLKNIAIGQGRISNALSSDGKAIVDSLGTPYKHNYLLSFMSELITSTIKETHRENTDVLSTTDKYNNISIY